MNATSAAIPEYGELFINSVEHYAKREDREESSRKLRNGVYISLPAKREDTPIRQNVIQQ